MKSGSCYQYGEAVILEDQAMLSADQVAKAVLSWAS